MCPIWSQLLSLEMSREIFNGLYESPTSPFYLIALSTFHPSPITSFSLCWRCGCQFDRLLQTSRVTFVRFCRSRWFEGRSVRARVSCWVSTVRREWWRWIEVLRWTTAESVFFRSRTCAACRPTHAKHHRPAQQCSSCVPEHSTEF